MKPKILFVCSVSPVKINKLNPLGGGTLDNHLLFDYLKNYFEIHILTSEEGIPVGTHNFDGIVLHKINIRLIPKTGILNQMIQCNAFTRELRKLLNEIKFDFVIAETYLIVLSQRCAHSRGVKFVAWIKAHEMFYLKDDHLFYSRLRSIDSYLREIYYKKPTRHSIGRAELVLTNSIFMQRRVQEAFKVNSEIIYPPINLQDYAGITHEEEARVGFIKPEERKGLGILVEIAKQMPDVKFICFGRKPPGYDSLEKQLPNIEFRGWEPDPAKIFNSFKILVAPSIYPEAFGRMAIEAFASGIVPIVANNGGLAEAVGNRKDLIVDDVYDIKDWKEKIRLFLNDKQKYDSLVEEGRKFVSRFSVENQGLQLRDLLLSHKSASNIKDSVRN